MNAYEVVPYFFAASLGALVGLGELLSRYRDAARRMLFSPPAVLYMAINAAASGAALGLLSAFEVSFGLPDKSRGLPLLLVIVSGLGAMALFRSSFFVVRVADQDVSVGPGSFLQLVLSATDRAVDRIQGAGRGKIAGELTRGISFTKAYQVLPVSCLNLVQGVPAAEQEALSQDIQKLLVNTEIPDSAKAYNLGLLLIQMVGDDVLRTAIQGLGETIRVGAGSDATSAVQTLGDARIAGMVTGG